MAQFQFRRFQGVPVVIKNLIIINALVWLIQITFGRSFPVEDFFALHDLHSPLFRPHQLITHLFMHDPDSIWHLFFNMFALWMFGSVLETVWGPKRFLTFYILCGLGAAVMHLTVLWFQNGALLQQFNELGSIEQSGVRAVVSQRINEATLGASGAIFGCLAGYGFMFPNTLIYIYFLFPIKAKWVVIFYAIFELFAGVRSTAGDNVAHFAHIGGALVGFLLVLYWKRTGKRNFY